MPNYLKHSILLGGMAFLDPILGWLLYLHPLLAIIIISFLVSITVTLAIKLFTDQSLMKDLKQELKELQKQMKTLKNNPKKMAKVNSQFMETNMKYMTQSMRPTLFTFLPIILVFGWLNAHIAYYPLMPNQPFELTAEFSVLGGEATLDTPQNLQVMEEATKQVNKKTMRWILQGPAGDYNVQLRYNNETFEKRILITEERAYAPVEKSYTGGFLFFGGESRGVDTIRLDNEQVQPFSQVPVLQSIPWVSTWGWLGAYIVFSLVFSLTLRKALNIY